MFSKAFAWFALSVFCGQLLLGSCEQSFSFLSVVMVTTQRTVDSASDYTNFTLTGSLTTSSIDVNNGWLAVGLNNQSRMVRFLLQLIISICHLFDTIGHLVGR